MSVVESLSPEEYLAALATATRVLEDHAVALDRLDNPTSADGESSEARIQGAGTDLAATLGAAVGAAEGRHDFAGICSGLQEGARRGARGRAGRGTARLLTGVGEVLCNADRLDAARFALALEAAAERFTSTDQGEHPGGFAAVVIAAADGALSASDAGANLPDTIVAAADSGLEELERGPEADPRLAAKGVVDAAAAGFLLVLDTLASIVTGEPLPAPPDDASLRLLSGPTGLTYEVGCRLIPDDGGIEAAQHLEDTLRELGDVVLWEVPGDSWGVTVHTAVPGAVVEALVEVGRPREIHIALVAASATARELARATG